MDLPANQFKRAIASGKTPIGAWLMSAAPSTAEALGSVGFDFLVVDMEHTPIDTPQMIGILQAIAGTPAQAIVRPPWNDMVMVKRAMDAGAQTLLFPFVQNADEAKRAVASTRYPPTACAASPGPIAAAATARYRITSSAPTKKCASSCRSKPCRHSISFRRSPPFRAWIRFSSAPEICRRRWVSLATSATPRFRTS